MPGISPGSAKNVEVHKAHHGRRFSLFLRFLALGSLETDGRNRM